MHIHRLEAIFIYASLGMLAAFAGAIIISVFGLGLHLPTVTDQIDPQSVPTDPHFSDPGVREIYPGRYEAYIRVQMWQFTPAEITVPVDSTVTFFLASQDVIHGFKMLDTDINIMVIPGQLSEVTHTFDETGDYLWFCHEYCGGLHQQMSGYVHVVEE
jgi:cytochrome c oxidase subunit 2